MKETRWKTWLFRIVRLLAVGYVALNLFACMMVERMIFMPPPASHGVSAEETVRLGAADEFAGLYFSAKEDDAPTLIWAHGNGEDAGRVSSLAQRFQEKGVSVLVYDYPGYGLSLGKPSEKGTYQAAEAAYRFLVEEKKKSPERIFLLGQSVGGGPSTYLAEQHEAGGLILISPFKSAYRVVTNVKIFPFDRFDNWKRMPNVKMPLLVIHGEQDGIIPFAHGKALFERHGGKKEFLALEGVGHNDLWPLAEDQVAEAILRFVGVSSE